MSGLSGRRWSSACAIALLCLGLSVPIQASTPDASSRLAGAIRDSVGQVLDGVEVLIVRKSSTVDPVAIASTDSWGRFTIPDLPPGVYSIAALKKGYRTFIGNVDTRIQRFVEVVLFPTPAGGEVSPGTVPQDGAWILRVPRRTVFRETEAGTGAGEDSAEVEGAAMPVEPPINMRVDQLFAVGAPFPGQDGEPVKLQGNETRVRLATPIGQRGRLRLDGQRESLGSSLRTDDTDSASSESAGLGVDLALDIGANSRVGLKAFFREHDMEWGAPALPLGSSRQSWGYESEWQTQLTDLSNLRLELDYNNDALRLPREEASPIAADPTLLRRNLMAGAAYESLATARHQLQVGVKARLFDASGRLGDEGTLPAVDLGPDAEGFSLHLNARDAWAVSGPFTLLYGLDYKHAQTDRDTAVLVPSVGGAWAVDRVALRFSVSYHSVSLGGISSAGSKYGATPPSSADPMPVGAQRDSLLSAREVGYEAEVEFPITSALRLRGASSFLPIGLQGIDAPVRVDGTWSHPPYLGDGTASLGETSLSLVQDLGEARTWFEISRGESRGMLAMGAGQPMMLPTLAVGALTYDNGRVGFQMIPSGTDLQVEYRRVVESQSGDVGGAAPDSEREMLELRLIQDLMRFHSMGNWRLLMAVRMARQDPESEQGWAEGTDPAVLRAFNEGVSAGLSVSF